MVSASAEIGGRYGSAAAAWRRPGGGRMGGQVGTSTDRHWKPPSTDR